MSAHSCDWLGCEPEVRLHANNDHGGLLQEIGQATAELLADLTDHADLSEKQAAAAVAELLAELRWRREQDAVMKAHFALGRGRRLRTALAALPVPTPQWGVIAAPEPLAAAQ